MRFEVKNRVIQYIYETPKVGDNADYIAEFLLDDEWKGRIVTARFIQNKHCIDKVLNNNKCEIPLDVLKKGNLNVGVYTTDMVSTSCDVFIRASIKNEDAIIPIPSDDIYLQLLQKIEDLSIQGVTDEQIARAVENYLLNNPIEGNVSQEQVTEIIANYIRDNIGEVTDGQDGKSAYDLAVENGYTGTAQEWLESLKGADGNVSDEQIENVVNGKYLPIDSVIDENWENWKVIGYPNGFDKKLAKIWREMFGVIKNNGTIVVQCCNDTRWHGDNLKEGGHILEGWDSEKKNRMTLLVLDQNSDIVSKYSIFDTDGLGRIALQCFTIDTSQDRFGWVKVGSDSRYDYRGGTEFTDKWVKAHTPFTFQPQATPLQMPSLKDTTYAPQMKNGTFFVDFKGVPHFLIDGEWYKVPLVKDDELVFPNNFNLETVSISDFGSGWFNRIWGGGYENNDAYSCSKKFYKVENGASYVFHTSKPLSLLKYYSNGRLRSTVDTTINDGDTYTVSSGEVFITLSVLSPIDEISNATISVIKNGEETTTKTLSSITATKTKTSYTVGEQLTTTDINVTAIYSDGTDVNVSDFTVDTSNVNMEIANTYKIIVSYTKNGVVKTCDINITVTESEPVTPSDNLIKLSEMDLSYSYNDTIYDKNVTYDAEVDTATYPYWAIVWNSSSASNVDKGCYLVMSDNQMTRSSKTGTALQNNGNAYIYLILSNGLSSTNSGCGETTNIGVSNITSAKCEILYSNHDIYEKSNNTIVFNKNV